MKRFGVEYRFRPWETNNQENQAYFLYLNILHAKAPGIGIPEEKGGGVPNAIYDTIEIHKKAVSNIIWYR